MFDSFVKFANEQIRDSFAVKHPRPDGFHCTPITRLYDELAAENSLYQSTAKYDIISRQSKKFVRETRYAETQQAL